MAIGKLRDFDREHLIRACSIAFGQIGGTMQAHAEGSSLLAVQMGFAARNAFVACDLAAAGIDGPREIIEGEYGYLKLIEDGYDFGQLLVNLGQDWQITKVAHKPFPSGRATHGIVDCCLELREKYRISANKITSVVCEVPPLIHQLVGRLPNKNMTPNYARLCGPYTVARALMHGTVDVSHYRPEQIADNITHELATRIEMSIDNNPDPNALTPVKVTINLQHGQSFTTERKFVL